MQDWVFRLGEKHFNASYLSKSYTVFTLKMESVHKITIFGLNMTMKSGLEKVFLKFLHAEAIVLLIIE